MRYLAAFATALSLIGAPAAAQETHPLNYCWIDLGDGAVDLSALCGGSETPVVPATAPVSSGGSSLAEEVTARYLAAVRNMTYGGQLSSDVTTGTRDPYIDALIFCDWLGFSDNRAGLILNILDAENYSERDRPLEEDHWIAVSVAARHPEMCP